MAPFDPPMVYAALATHQVAEQAWAYQAIVREFQRWREIFNSEFKLELTPTAFRIGGAKSNCYGHFRPGPNDFGLAREIAFNEHALLSRLANNEFWRAVGTLLHELLHAWQYDHGKPSDWNHHNIEFRAKAASVGLIIGPRGVTDYAPDSPFIRLLSSHGVVVPHLPQYVTRVSDSGSKLKKWSCGCTNVRVAVADFRATCLKCGREFARQP